MRVNSIRLGRIFKWDFEDGNTLSSFDNNYKLFGFGEYVGNIWRHNSFTQDLGLFYSHCRLRKYTDSVDIDVFFLNWKALEYRAEELRKQRYMRKRYNSRRWVSSGLSQSQIAARKMNRFSLKPRMNKFAKLGLALKKPAYPKVLFAGFAKWLPANVKYFSTKRKRISGFGNHGRNSWMFQGRNRFRTREVKLDLDDVDLFGTHYMGKKELMPKLPKRRHYKENYSLEQLFTTHIHIIKALFKKQTNLFIYGVNYIRELCKLMSTRDPKLLYVWKYLMSYYLSVYNWCILLRNYRRAFKYSMKTFKLFCNGLDKVYHKHIDNFRFLAVNWFDKLGHVPGAEEQSRHGLLTTFTKSNTLLTLAGIKFFGLPVRLHYVDLGMRYVTAEILSRYVCVRLAQGVSIREIYKVIKRTLSKLSVFVLGFKIQCSGRFTRAQRAGVKRVNFGKVGKTTVDSIVSYSFHKVILKFGCCGVKVWMNRRFNKRKTISLSGREQQSVRIIKLLTRTYLRLKKRNRRRGLI